MNDADREFDEPKGPDDESQRLAGDPRPPVVIELLRSVVACAKGLFLVNVPLESLPRARSSTSLTVGMCIAVMATGVLLDDARSVGALLTSMAAASFLAMRLGSGRVRGVIIGAYYASAVATVVGMYLTVILGSALFALAAVFAPSMGLTLVDAQGPAGTFAGPAGTFASIWQLMAVFGATRKLAAAALPPAAVDRPDPDAGPGADT